MAVVDETATKLHVLLTFDNMQNPLPLPHKPTSERPKVLQASQFFTRLTSKCASRHNGLHVFDIATSKSGPSTVCFVHFDFEACFAPQRRTLFRHRNFQKWSEHGVLRTFWLRNVLCATAACTFSTSQLPKVIRAWCVLYFWLRNVLSTTACNFSSLIWPDGSAPAALASLLSDPPEPKSLELERGGRKVGGGKYRRDRKREKLDEEKNNVSITRTNARSRCWVCWQDTSRWG